MLYIEFIYRTSAVSYSTSQEEYRKIFVFNFFRNPVESEFLSLFWGFIPLCVVLVVEGVERYVKSAERHCSLTAFKLNPEHFAHLRQTGERSSFRWM